MSCGCAFDKDQEYLSLTILYPTQRVQYKRLQREYDAAMGVEQVQPNKRLDQTRLEKLNSIGFVWSAKTPRKPSPLQDSSANQENTTAILPKAKPKKPNMDGKELVSRHVARGEDEWTEMYERLVKYKEEHGVSRSLWRTSSFAIATN